MDPISRLQVTKLSAGDVDRMLTRRLGTGIAPRTAFHIRAVLRTALNAAILQLIATNPAARAEAPDVPDQEMLTLSTKEVGELIGLSQEHRDGPLRSFLVGLGLEGGCVPARGQPGPGTLEANRDLERLRPPIGRGTKEAGDNSGQSVGPIAGGGSAEAKAAAHLRTDRRGRPTGNGQTAGRGEGSTVAIRGRRC